ncbi:Hypothetical protein PHPALM_1568 [Phytophthora palmivora]|uniref:Uncharacterized protein n=1 Tax=Phytophthora palmivora TaxID=4796 RepID=A0A2P4YS22_9STRA|nr:Hypothetical protein PHPALM_1568 [Phytophthora palmivora]
MEATSQQLVIKEVINVARRNNKLRRQVHLLVYPIRQFPWFHWKWIHTSASLSVRMAGQSATGRLAKCPFQKLAQVANACDETWCISIKHEFFFHNHRFSNDIYRFHPGIRQVPADSPLIPGIQLLVEAEAGTSPIYDYVRSNSAHRVTMTDILGFH